MSILKKIIPPVLYKKSYSQCGEDMIIDFLFEVKGIKNPSYLDIGSNEPVKYNNSYFFYKNRNGKGVLIEPNPALADKIKSKRERDVLISAGVGFNDREEEADYYVMDWHMFNTFSKEIAEETEKNYNGRNNIKGVIKLKLTPINDVLKNHFSKGLDLLSIDVEGLDFEILSSIDYTKYQPLVICAETKVGADNNASKIADFLATKGYQLYSQTPINGIFVHKNYINRNK